MIAVAVAMWMSGMNVADVIVVAIRKTLVIVSHVVFVMMEVDIVGDFVQGLLENNQSIS